MSSNGIQTERAAMPGSLTAGWLLARLFLGQAIGRRRSLWLGLGLLVPIGLSIWWRIVEGGSGTGFFLEMTVNVLLQFFVLGLTLYLGVAAVRDEIEDRTIVYLFARPVHRAVILGGKIASVAVTVAVAVSSVAGVVYLITVSSDGLVGLGTGLGHLLAAVAAIGLACLAYTSLFALLGVLFRRPMIPAIVLAFGWEGILANVPGEFPRATLMFYVKSVLGIGPEDAGVLSMLVASIEPATVAGAVAVLLVVASILLGAALGIGARKEYRV